MARPLRALAPLARTRRWQAVLASVAAAALPQIAILAEVIADPAASAQLDAGPRIARIARRLVDQCSDLVWAVNRRATTRSASRSGCGTTPYR